MTGLNLNKIVLGKRLKAKKLIVSKKNCASTLFAFVLDPTRDFFPYL